MRLSLALLVFILPVPRILGCSCDQPSSPCQAAGYAAAAFIGTVLNVSDEPQSSRQLRVVKVQIREVLSGVRMEQNQIEVLTGRGGGDCGYPFQANADYVIYAHKNSEGKLETGICSGTKPLGEADADASYFRQMAKAPNTASLRVSTRIGRAAGTPGIAIVAAGEKSRYRALTNSEGDAVFDGLSPGDYSIHEERDGDLSDDPKIHLNAKGCSSTYKFRVLRLVGQVRTKDGQPASRIGVETRSVENVADMSYTTGLDGKFEISIIKPGQYYVGINLNHAASSFSPFPRWFYPGTANPASATKFEFTGSPQTRTLELTVPDQQPAREIEGVVLTREGNPRERTVVTVFDDTGSIVNTGFADQDGRFTIPAFVGTPYIVRAVWPGDTPASAAFAKPLRVDAGELPLHIRIVLTERGYPNP